MRFKKNEYKKTIRSIIKMNEPEIAVDKIVEIIKGEFIAKEHFREKMTTALIQLQDIKDKGW